MDERKKVTQTILAKKLGISQSLLSRQLLGKEKISIDRIREIIGILQPSANETILIYKMLVDDYGKDRCFADLHDKINSIGPDPLLGRLLDVWTSFSQAEKENIDSIITVIEKRMHENAIKLQRDKIPAELMQMMSEAEKWPPIIQKAFFALVDYISGTPREENPSAVEKMIYDEEDEILKTFGVENLIKLFGLIPADKDFILNSPLCELLPEPSNRTHHP